MSKLGRKLLGTIFDIEGGDDEDVSTEVSASTPVKSNVVMPTTLTSVGNVNQDMTDLLMNAINDANLEGFDYIEFKQAVGKMMNIPMTEQQRFQTVFATAQAMGVTVDSLVNSVDHYISVIGKQRDGFMGSASNATIKEVDTRMALISENEQKIQEATQKINELTAFITQTQQENIKITQEANSEKLKIDTNVASFEATFNMVSSRLVEDKQKLVSYLGTN